MKNEELHIVLMIGSIRKERSSHKPAQVIVKLLEDRGVLVEILDLQELDLPVFDDGLDATGAEKLLEAYKKMDGMILVNPEYNHTISSSVKNAIDFARSKELVNKPMTLVTTSMGGWGGLRSVYPVRQAWFGVGGQPMKPNLQTKDVTKFDVENPDENWLKAANRFVDDSLRWFRIIKAGSALEQE